MAFLNEELYFYYISLKTKFVSFDEYEKWLHKVFTDNPQSEVLLELECYSKNEEKTIDELYIYLYDKIASLNYHKVMKKIMDKVRVRYTNHPDSLQEATDKLCQIWRLLPEEISYEQPFLTLCSVNDYWDLGEEYGMKNVNWLLNYPWDE